MAVAKHVARGLTVTETEAVGGGLPAGPVRPPIILLPLPEPPIPVGSLPSPFFPTPAPIPFTPMPSPIED